MRQSLIVLCGCPRSTYLEADLIVVVIKKVCVQLKSISPTLLAGLASRERSPVQLESQQLCKEREIIMKGPGGGWDDHGNLQLGNFLANPNRFCPLFEPLA